MNHDTPLTIAMAIYETLPAEERMRVARLVAITSCPLSLAIAAVLENRPPAEDAARAA